MKSILMRVWCVALVVAAAPAALAQKTLDPKALAAPPTTGWLTNGGSLSNQRWSPLKGINRDNVAQLKGLWRTHLNGSGMETKHSGESQPLVQDGVIYNVTGSDDVFALSVETGEILWQYKAEFEPAMGGQVCCGWTSRGVAISDDMVFVGQLDARMVALDKKTGKVRWKSQARLWQEGYSITSAPLYYDGLVITGYAGAERGIRGVVDAFDAKTGKLKWSFYTVPGPGEFGHDTWPSNNDVWKLGGGSVWQTPAVDPELGLVYFSTGNPGPDYNGYVRAGDNLFTASVVALDVHTGKYRWHFQEVHHDLWDYDAPNPVILFDIDLSGAKRKGIASASKNGWIYLLDRTNGKPLIGIDEQPVMQEPAQKTAATQPVPRGDSFVPHFVDIPPENTPLVNGGKLFTPFTYAKPALIQPGPAGAANWPPSSIDPERHMMFVCGSENSFVLQGGDPELKIPAASDGKSFTGGGFLGTRPPTRGIIAAMNLATNTLVWQFRLLDNSCYSGFVSTAGGLLFQGRNDGRLTALNSDTGMRLWEFQTGAGMNSAVTVFEHKGKQYVLAYSAGNVFAGSAHGDSLWLFALDGKLEPAKAGDTQPVNAATVAPTAAAAVTGKADVKAGETLYKQTCLPCHGEDGLGGHGGGKTLVELKSAADAITVISSGRNNMPAFKAALTAEQIRDVGSFVVDVLIKH